MRDASTKSLFEYTEIVGNRDDVLKLWPPAGTTATPERAETPGTAIAKPAGISPLVWAIVVTLANIEKETPTGLAGFTQDQLTEAVSARLARRVSKRTCKKPSLCVGKAAAASRQFSDLWRVGRRGAFLRFPGDLLRVLGEDLRNVAGARGRGSGHANRASYKS